MMDYNAQVKHWDDIQIGDVSTFSKTMTETDMILWVGLTGDMNPVHIDKEYGKTTRFKDVISTVMTKATFGNVYYGQTLKFLKPVYVGDTITAVATVVDKLEEKHRAVIKTECFNQRGELVIVGEGQEYIM